MKRTLLMVLCIMTLGLSLTACSGSLKASDILINTLPKTVFYLNEAEQSFTDSLKDGTIKLRYTTDVDSDPIPMNDTNIIVSGFSSKTVGDKHITVKHKDFPDLSAIFSITIEEIKPVAVTVDTKPTVLTYYSDVELNDIDLSGGKFKVAYNNGSTEIVEMNEETAEAIAITMLAGEGEGIVADVKVQYLGTNCIADYKVQITVPTAVDFKIVQNPLNVFYANEPTISDIDLDGLTLELTKNSGKKIELNGLGADDVTFVGKIIIESVEDGKVVLQLFETEIKCEFDYFVFGEGVLSEQFINSFDWNDLTALDEEDARRVYVAFLALSDFTQKQLDAFAALKTAAADIKEMALYISYELATNVCDDAFIAALDWDNLVEQDEQLLEELHRAFDIATRFTKVEITTILDKKFTVVEPEEGGEPTAEPVEESYFVDNLIIATIYSDYARLIALKAEFDAIEEPELLDAAEFFLCLERIETYKAFKDMVLYVDNSDATPINVKVSAILLEVGKLGAEVLETFD